MFSVSNFDNNNPDDREFLRVFRFWLNPALASIKKVSIHWVGILGEFKMSMLIIDESTFGLG